MKSWGILRAWGKVGYGHKEAFWEAEAGGSLEPGSWRLTWATKQVSISTKNFKITYVGLGAVAHAYNPRTLGNQGGWIMSSRDWDHFGHDETPSLLKIQKLAGHGGMLLWSQLLGRLWQKNCLNPGGGGCSEPRLGHCIPAWATTAKLCLRKK